MRLLSVALVCATLAASSPVGAFAVPRRKTLRDRRTALLGTWRAVTYKKQLNSSVTDPGITVSFEREKVWLEHLAKTESGSWRIVAHDEELLGVEITDDKGHIHKLDALVEGSDSLTLYVEDDDGDDYETLRLERLR